MPGAFCIAPGLDPFVAGAPEVGGAVPVGEAVFVFSPSGVAGPVALTHGAPEAPGAGGCALDGTAFVGSGAACVGAGGGVVLSPAALVVIGVGGPMVVGGGVIVELPGGVVVVDGGMGAVGVAGAVVVGGVVGVAVGGGGVERGLWAAAQLAQVNSNKNVIRRVVMRILRGEGLCRRVIAAMHFS